MKKANVLTSIAIAIVLALVWINYPPKEEQMVFSLPSFSLDLDSFFRKLFPEPTPLTEAEKAAIKEEIEKNTEVTHGKDYVGVKYTKWLWESPQENFGIFHSQKRRESWGDYDTESNEIGIGISFNFTSKESKYSKWEYFPWPGEVTPGKEKENHQEITPTTSTLTIPVISEELSSEIEPASLKWESWNTMWGLQKSQ